MFYQLSALDLAMRDEEVVCKNKIEFVFYFSRLGILRELRAEFFDASTVSCVLLQLVLVVFPSTTAMRTRETGWAVGYMSLLADGHALWDAGLEPL